jgi:hypothetical protein
MSTLTGVFPCFSLSCKANARVNPQRRVTARTLFNFCVFYIFLVLFYVFLCCSMYCLFCFILCIVCVHMCTVLLSPGGYPIAVKYIISYITYHISYLQKKRNLSENACSQHSLADNCVPISSFYVYSFCKVQHPHNNLFGPAGDYLALTLILLMWRKG